MKRFFKDRHTIVSIVLVLIFAVIIYQLANLQLVQGENYYTQSQVYNLRTSTIFAERGNIVDRYGVPIAVNSTSYYLTLMNAGKPSEEMNDMVYKLIKILEKNGDKYNNTFSKYLSEKPVKFGTMLKNSKDRIKVLSNATGYKFSNLDQDSDPEEFYEYFRDTVFEIDTEKYKEPEIYKIITLRFEILTNNNPVIAESINAKTVAEIEERTDEFPGAIVDLVPSRKYIDAEYAAHLIGYVRTISEEELANRADEGYKPDDIIGKTGMERTAEGYLRGTNGYRKIEIDDNGKIKTISEEAVKPGSDVVLTIDMRLQKVAIESLEKNIKLIRQKPQSRNFKDADAGAAVAIDVNTGEVLAMASYPSYDPAIFLAGPENEAAQNAIRKLYDLNNKARPAFDRTINGTYAPGSTFKPLVAIAGLEEKKVNPYEKYFDKGYEIYDNMKLASIEYHSYGVGLGWVNLVQAIQKSSNPYFYNLGVKVGIDNIDKWATKFGLGQKTGIDLLDESTGILASKAYKKTYSPYMFGKADTAQTSIGQFDNSFTPIQLANYCATIANGGKRFKPHIIKRVVKYDGSIVTETKPEYELLPVKKENMKIIQEGMIAVANSEDRGGTAANAFNELLPIKVAGKTGTAETESTNQTRSSNALFICYAPADKPEVAVAVVVEKGVLGAYTAPIAKDILKAYFDNKGSNIQDIEIKSDIVELTK